MSKVFDNIAIDPSLRDNKLREAATKFGTPLYVYFADAIEQRITELNEAFADRFAISYAVKCNPNVGLLAWLKPRIENLDISSIGEMRLGIRAGWNPKDMSFTGPGKREFEIREAIEHGLGELIVESAAEAKIADHLARLANRTQDIVVRISPDYVPKGFGDQMAGRPSAFGIDVETVDDDLPIILALENLKVIGFHIYSGTQCLIPDAICENYAQFIRIFRNICERYDIVPQKLVFGSGLGIPHFENDKPLNLTAVSAGSSKELDAFKSEDRFQSTQFVLEIGRYLVGEAGYFLTRVTALKDSRGTRIAICDGGLNNHLAATGNFGMVVHRNYRMHMLGGGENCQKINLAGPLCTPLDRLGVGIDLPQVSVGDVIAVHNSGAYGLTASPLHFISHLPPSEVLVEGECMSDVTRALSGV